MVIKMSEVFNRKFPVSPTNIKAPALEARERILADLTESLALAQDDYEKKLRPPSETVMNRAMTE